MHWIINKEPLHVRNKEEERGETEAVQEVSQSWVSRVERMNCNKREDKTLVSGLK